MRTIPRSPTPARPLVLVALLVAVAACSGGGTRTTIPFDQPSVDLRDVRLRGAGMTGGALDLDLSVFNPNGYELAQPRVHYRVYVGDVRVATGYTDVDVTVGARDSAKVSLPASFSYLALGRAGNVLKGRGSANYRVLGTITAGTPYGRISFPYDRIGRFSPMNVPLPH